MVYIGIAVTFIAIVALIVSIVSNSGKSKRSISAYDDNLTEESQIIDSNLIDDPDDDYDIPDESGSSAVAYKSFVGIWYKAETDEQHKAILSVSAQFADSFEFTLELWNGSDSKIFTETAFYTDETHASYSPKKKVSLVLERGDDYVVITHTGKNSDFGIDSKYVLDGRFTADEPVYSSESVAESKYDYNIYKSDAVVKALSETLSDKDYAMYKDMMENGLKSPINYERTTDRNGNLVNVDEELDAVKYYAHLNNGYDMIFICSENADFYLLFYNSDEIIYCTNDNKYYKKMPKSFQAVADAKNIKPTFR